eukprot:3332423-Rhodomonas_salina.3
MATDDEWSKAALGLLSKWWPSDVCHNGPGVIVVDSAAVTAVEGPTGEAWPESRLPRIHSMTPRDHTLYNRDHESQQQREISSPTDVETLGL